MGPPPKRWREAEGKVDSPRHLKPKTYKWECQAYGFWGGGYLTTHYRLCLQDPKYRDVKALSKA
jgi:hypothetical protein